jgi:hypothetical protein
MRISRPLLVLPFALALVLAQFRESGLQELHARLTLATDPRMPVRVYLFKDGRPFRLSPVQALLPLRVDSFYRERIWRSGTQPETLEVTCRDFSHFFLLKGRATFNLPAGRYRVEAYRGLFYEPAQAGFELRAGENRQVTLPMVNWAGEESQKWLAGDDHIHITRAEEDNEVLLGWLEAEDLQVANFLQLQRQMDAAVQYAFGEKGEARRGVYVIRPGHESRSEWYGHVNLLGGRELIRPLSIGAMYANSDEAYPYPAVLFAQGRKVGATVGYAHFSGSMPHSTLLLDLALGNIDFVEVFQFGVLKRAEWYEVLNAGFRVAGIAGSDFPVGLNRVEQWPRWVPLLGPERTLVRARGAGSPYEEWAAGVRRAQAVVSNGPLVDVKLDPAASTVSAQARFWRPLETLEIIKNGSVEALVPGDGRRTALAASARIECPESCWVAARTRARKEPEEPEIQAHTNPIWWIRNGKSVNAGGARTELARRWAAEIDYYRSAGLRFPSEEHRQEFFRAAERALARLREPEWDERRP